MSHVSQGESTVAVAGTRNWAQGGPGVMYQLRTSGLMLDSVWIMLVLRQTVRPGAVLPATDQVLGWVNQSMLWLVKCRANKLLLLKE